ncbi:MAG: phosphotransferase [Anaerolineae bacterium]|nr:phosphotransferase [Anaerolineae bacterium]
MSPAYSTPARSSNSQRQPASPRSLRALLRELDIQPPDRVSFKLVSRWAAKHVWRVKIGGTPWAYVRYLLGSAERYPERWRHMRLGKELYEARVGPRILGITSESEALSGRAAIVEAALLPIPRVVLESRAEEAIALLGRLHSCVPLLAALSEDLTEADRNGFSPLANLFVETRERWFEAVTGRWLEIGLPQITEVTQIISVLLNRLEAIEHSTSRLGIEIVVPAHNDPNAGNFMVNRQGALRMIDFEGLALSNPVADLGIFLTWYVDKYRHRAVLANYPLAEPDAALARMRVWVPLRYIGIAAHWAARLSRARNIEAWQFATDSVDEWLRGACELIFSGAVPGNLNRTLTQVHESLLAYPVLWMDDETSD